MPDAIDLSGDDDLGRAAEGADRLSGAVDQLTPHIRELQSGANGFARAMTSAFTSSVISGRQFDDVLKTLALRLSDTALKSALAPITRGLATGISQLFSGLFGGAGGAAVAAASGAVKPFAAGGVIGTPTYFPLSSGDSDLPAKPGRKRLCRCRAERTAGSASRQPAAAAQPR